MESVKEGVDVGVTDTFATISAFFIDCLLIGECRPGLILIDGDLLLVPWDTGGGTGSGWEDGEFSANGRDKDNAPGADIEFVESPAAEAEVGGDPDASLDDVESLEGGREKGYNSGVGSKTWS